MVATRESAYDEVTDAARDFRVLLSAMARPATIHDFGELTLAPPPGLPVASAAVALALLSAETGFAVTGLPEAALRYLAVNTRCEAVSMAEADFVFFGSGDEGEQQLAVMKRGSLEYPDQGGTAIVAVEELSGQPGVGRLAVRAQGPGIDGAAIFYVKGLHPVWLATLRSANSEYPLGVDAIFTCESRLVCLPRSSSFEWE
jgi:alpha-D-ribose 1-methylphosphonate 5-triphosphate synthase subunit PhnH